MANSNVSTRFPVKLSSKYIEPVTGRPHFSFFLEFCFLSGPSLLGILFHLNLLGK